MWQMCLNEYICYIIFKYKLLLNGVLFLQMFLHIRSRRYAIQLFKCS